MKLPYPVFALLLLSTPALCVEKTRSCMEQMSEARLSGGEANAFFSKCVEEIKASCAEGHRNGSGVERLRAISKCVRDGAGN